MTPLSIDDFIFFRPIPANLQLGGAGHWRRCLPPTRFLAKIRERRESRIEAARLFALSRSLLDRGHSAEAVDRLKDALEIERGNRDFQRALAQAQLAAGQTPDAETTLNDLLLSDSTDGPANLTMGARAPQRKAESREAISYYHRAIYGQWKDDAQKNRSR